MSGSELRGLLHPLLLLLLLERPGHGYDLIDRLSGLGVPDLEHGHVYRVLRSLERDRALVSVWETAGAGPARRRYELTDKGRDDLRGWADRLSRLDRVLDTCLRRWATAAEAGAARPRAGAPTRHAGRGHPPTFSRS